MACGACGKKTQIVNRAASGQKPMQRVMRLPPPMAKIRQIPAVIQQRGICPLCRNKLQSVFRQMDGRKFEVLQCINHKCNYMRKI